MSRIYSTINLHFVRPVSFICGETHAFLWLDSLVEILNCMAKLYNFQKQNFWWTWATNCDNSDFSTFLEDPVYLKTSHQIFTNNVLNRARTGELHGKEYFSKNHVKFNTKYSPEHFAKLAKKFQEKEVSTPRHPKSNHKQDILFLGIFCFWNLI